MGIFKTVKASIGVSHLMVGAICLFTPLYTLTLGLLPTLFANLFLLAASLTMSLLLVKHSGNTTTINECIWVHFKESSEILRVMFVFGNILNMLGTAATYVGIGIIQLRGLLPEYESEIPYIFFCIWVVLVLLAWYCSIDHNYVSFGFLSVIFFSMMLIWAIATAPAGYNRIELVKDFNIFNYLGLLMFAFAIQPGLFPFMEESGIKRKDYEKITYLGFLLTALFACWYCFAAYGIFNRTPRIPHPETIQDYFPYGNWEIAIIEITYLLHVFTNGPFYLLNLILYLKLLVKYTVQKKNWRLDISMIIFFSLFGLAVFLSGVPINRLVEVSGAFGSLFFVFIVPVSIHIKCKFFSDSNQTDNRLIEEEQNAQQAEKGQQKYVCYHPQATQITVFNILQIAWLGFCCLVGIGMVEEIIRKGVVSFLNRN